MENKKKYTIELVVAVDQLLEDRYGKNIKEYIELIIFKASYLYSNSNLKESINISLVKILHIKNELGEIATDGEGKQYKLNHHLTILLIF